MVREPRAHAPSAAVRRRTRLLALFGGTSALVLFTAELVRIWRLGALPLTRGDAVQARRSPRAAVHTLSEGYRISTTRDNAVFSMVASFVVTFGGARAITHAIRVRGRLGPIKNLQTASGRHIHHFLPGMAIALVAGGWSIGSKRQEVDRWLALPFGFGAALVLDETALLLELEDVYWSEEGLLSVQVAFAAVGLMAALAYFSRVTRQDLHSREQDWEIAARAFDQLQLLPGQDRSRGIPGA